MSKHDQQISIEGGILDLDYRERNQANNSTLLSMQSLDSSIAAEFIHNDSKIFVTLIQV